jgi:hypothetical protein
MSDTPTSNITNLLPEVASQETPDVSESQISPVDGTREVLPEPAPEAPKKPKRGGPSFHKPGCQCAYHRKYTARDWEEKAGSGADGVNPPSREALKRIEMYADMPPLVVQGRTARDRIAQWIEIRALEPDITNKEAARRIGIAPRYLNTLISEATKEGWLKIDDPLSRIEHEIIPKTLDNLQYFLKKKDRSVTIEVAKGTLFKQFAESKGIMDAPTTVLALKIESPGRDGSQPEVKIVQGTIVGRPKSFSDISNDE